jgi:cation transport ATPase
MSKTRTEWFSTFRYVVPADYENWMKNWLQMAGISIKSVNGVPSAWYSKKQIRNNIGTSLTFITAQSVIISKPTANLVGNLSVKWQAFHWRKEYTAIRPESFTDLESIEKRNRNVMNAVMVSFILFTVITLVMIAATLLSSSSMSSEETLQMVLFTACAALFSTYLGWVVWKIYHNRDR